jgi:hypothetical protein
MKCACSIKIRKLPCLDMKIERHLQYSDRAQVSSFVLKTLALTVFSLFLWPQPYLLRQHAGRRLAWRRLTHGKHPVAASRCQRVITRRNMKLIASTIATRINIAKITVAA